MARGPRRARSAPHTSHTMYRRTLPRAEAGESVGNKRVNARALAARIAGLVCFVPQGSHTTTVSDSHNANRVSRALRLKRWEVETTHSCAQQETARRRKAVETRRSHQRSPGSGRARPGLVLHGTGSPESHSSRGCGQGYRARTARSSMLQHRVSRQFLSPWTDGQDSAARPFRSLAVRAGPYWRAPPAIAYR